MNNAHTFIAIVIPTSRSSITTKSKSFSEPKNYPTHTKPKGYIQPMHKAQTHDIKARSKKPCITICNLEEKQFKKKQRRKLKSRERTDQRTKGVCSRTNLL